MSRIFVVRFLKDGLLNSYDICWCDSCRMTVSVMFIDYYYALLTVTASVPKFHSQSFQNFTCFTFFTRNLIIHRCSKSADTFPAVIFANTSTCQTNDASDGLGNNQPKLHRSHFGTVTLINKCKSTLNSSCRNIYSHQTNTLILFSSISFTVKRQSP